MSDRTNNYESKECKQRSEAEHQEKNSNFKQAILVTFLKLQTKMQNIHCPHFLVWGFFFPFNIINNFVPVSWVP